MGSGALRVLAFAYRDIVTGEREGIESQLVFAGLAGMMDPPREEAKEAISACHDAGIRVIMITGDNPETARAVAGELGIFGPGEAVVVTGPEMDRWSEEDFRTSVQNSPGLCPGEPGAQAPDRPCTAGQRRGRRDDR